MRSSAACAMATVLGLAMTGAPPAFAAVEVGPLIGDHMVVEQGRPIPLSGAAAPGEAVSATVAGGRAATKADANGRWTLTLPPLVAGGPFVLKIVGSNTLVFTDVWVGEVWVASGQSNMEFPLGRSFGGEHAVGSGCAGMHLFVVAHATALAPKGEVSGQWRTCDTASAAVFSAVAFHFGRQVHRALGVPVGLIQAAWGGTPAEAWTPRQALAAEASLAPMVENFDLALGDPERRKQIAGELAAWEAKNFHQDTGNRGEKLGYASPNGSGAGWSRMELPMLWENDGLVIDGAVWFRRDFAVPAGWAGAPLALSLGAIDDFDVTYWNGERIGATGSETPDYWSTPRHYTVPGRLVKAGRNVLAVRVFDHYGSGGFAGTKDQLNIKSTASEEPPLSLAGTWSYKIERRLKPIDADFASRPMNLGPQDPTSPFVLWNGMIAPLAGLPIAGVIWYQGETNVGRSLQYRTLFPTMIRAWRTAWANPKLPFVFVQLANFDERAGKEPVLGEGWAALREAQTFALGEPNTAMAVILDIGESRDIHPREKQEVGRRLALCALKTAYNRTVISSGPSLRDAFAERGAMRLRFSNLAGGLTTADGRPPRGFLIAGADRVWRAADARIEGEAVIVSSAEVAQPVAVRYGWGDDPPNSLCNQADLPAAPFRTDDWPFVPAVHGH